MIRAFDVPLEMVERRDVGVLSRLLAGELSGREARELQGSIFLAFPELERADVHLFSDDKVVDYLKAAHAAVPHLFYFLTSEPQAGALMGFIAGASGQPGVTPEESVVVDEQALLKLTWHLVHVAEYAESKGDDWHRSVEAWTSQLADEHRRLVERTVRATMEEE